MMNPDSEFAVIQDSRGANFECKRCGEVDEVQLTVWKNGIEIECARCGFTQLFKAEEPKSIYEEDDE